MCASQFDLSIIVNLADSHNNHTLQDVILLDSELLKQSTLVLKNQLGHHHQLIKGCLLRAALMFH